MVILGWFSIYTSILNSVLVLFKTIANFSLTRMSTIFSSWDFCMSIYKIMLIPILKSVKIKKPTVKNSNGSSFLTSWFYGGRGDEASVLRQ